MFRWFRKRPQAPVDYSDRPDPVPCACSCHANPLITHAAPCCLRCPKCGVGYPRVELPVHEQRCAGDVKPCACPCHRKPGMVHVMACCLPCATCGVNYPRADLERHERSCRSLRR